MNKDFEPDVIHECIFKDGVCDECLEKFELKTLQCLLGDPDPEPEYDQ